MNFLNKILLTSLIAILAITTGGSGCMDLFNYLPKSDSIKYTNSVQPNKINEIKYLTGNPLPPPPSCTKFADMRLKDNIRLVFVDKNSAASKAQADGSSWESAVHSIAKALHIAKNKIRIDNRFAGTIYIIIAGGNYSFSHENTELNVGGHPGLGTNGSIITIGDKAPGYNFGINIYGGYNSGSSCLEDLGKNPEPSTLDGENQSNNVVSIIGDATDIEFKHLTITRGHARAANKRDGGGISITKQPKNISFEKITVSECKADDGGALAIKGVFYDSTKGISIKDSHFINNEALDEGGALYINYGEIIAHENNKYVSNRARSGGAIYVEGCSDSLNKPAPMPMKNIQCQENYAVNNGGCAYIDKAPSTFIDGGNYHYNGYKDALNSTGHGGAIYYISDSIGQKVNGPDDPRLDDKDFHSLLKINKAEFYSNTATNGGAIFSRGMFSLEVNDASFEKNQANQFGGAIHIDTSNHSSAANDAFKPGANISIKNSFFKENSAVHLNGGAIYADTVNNLSLINDKITLASMYEALLERRHNQDYASMPELRDEENMPRFLKNSAGASGGAIWIKQAEGEIQIYDQAWLANKSEALGGAIYIGNSKRNIHIKNPLFFYNSAGLKGGAIYIGQAKSFIMDTKPEHNYIAQHKERFDTNHSIYPHAHVLAGRPTNMMTQRIDNARGIFLIRSNKTINGDGGAVYLKRVDSFNVKNMSFLSNIAERGRGGAIFIKNLQVDAYINDSIIYGSKAYKDAGAMWVKGAFGANPILNISDSNIQKNSLPDPNVCIGSAGIYGIGLGLVTIARTNFFDNIVESALAGSICAASMKFDSLIPQPSAFILSDRDNDTGIIEPLQIKGNKINLPDPANNPEHLSGTIIIPNNVYLRKNNDLNSFFGTTNNNPFDEDDNSERPPTIQQRVNGGANHNQFDIVVSGF